MSLLLTLTQSLTKLTSLQTHLLPPSTPTPPRPTHPTSARPTTSAYDNLLILLKHTKQEITSLSLAFSGEKVLEAAAREKVGVVGDDYSRLVAVVVGVQGEGEGEDGGGGGCLASEWAREVGELGGEVIRLVEIFIETTSTSTSTSTKKPTPTPTTTPTPKPYLIQTSQIWAHIDRLIQTISNSEEQAVGKVWEADGGCLRDAWEEFGGLGEGEGEDDDEDDEGDEDEGDEDEGDEDEDEGDEGDEDDDEWAELERALQGGDQEKMTVVEKRRVESLHLPLKLLITLHKHYLPPTLALSLPTHLSLSHDLVEGVDTLVSALYTPQDEQEVERALEGVVGVGRRMVRLSLGVIRGEEDGLEKKLNGLSVVGSDPEVLPLHKRNAADLERRGKEEKWFIVWEDQMDKAILARKEMMGRD